MNKYIIGLTGQSGAGKTTVSKYFRQKGFAVIDCDIVARNVTRQGNCCNKELAEIFPQCFDENLSLDRQAMAKIVFSNKDKLNQLNNIIFPHITSDIKTEIERLVKEGEGYIILDAPTLFEAGVDKLCHCIISCVADKNTRAKRISERDKISMDLILQRFESQKTEEFFKEHSDYIIENNSDENTALKQCDKIIEDIKRRFNG